MIYPSTFEHKTGFDTIRLYVKERCVSPLGIERVERMAFSSDHHIVEQRLKAVSEMIAVKLPTTDSLSKTCMMSHLN